MNISELYQPKRQNLKVYGSISGNYSFRSEKTIWFESSLERDFLIRSEYDSEILDIVGQPIQIPYTTTLGNSSLYTPDFLVQYFDADKHGKSINSAPLLVEIKPTKKIIKDWKILKPKFLAAQKFAKLQGWRFKIYNESRLYDSYWENITVLKKFKKSLIEADIESAILSKINTVPCITLEQLEYYMKETLKTNIEYRNLIISLIAKRKINSDLRLPLNPKTLLWKI